MISYDKFQKSLKHLELQYKNHTTMDETLPILIKEAVSESVIQRFETCFDCMWKILKRYLEQDLGIANLPNGPKPLFRIANENNLFKDGVEPWLEYSNARNSTSHDYSGKKALAALDIMGYFIHDAIHLYETMSHDTWK